MSETTKRYEEFKGHFTLVLRRLCDQGTSVNKICREIGINRQQFSKYLTGVNLPSIFALQRIIDYFQTDPRQFFIGLEVTAPSPVPTASQAAEKECPCPDIKRGFYLEYSTSCIGEKEAIRVSAWRVFVRDGQLHCQGEVPKDVNLKAAPTFNRFRGTFSPVGANFLMHATAFSQFENDLIFFLTPYTLGPAHFLAVRLRGKGQREATITSAASMFRYVGEEPDVADLIVNHCGLFEMPSADEHMNAIRRQLLEHCDTSGGHLRLAP